MYTGSLSEVEIYPHETAGPRMMEDLWASGDGAKEPQDESAQRGEPDGEKTKNEIPQDASLLAAIVECSDDAIIFKDLNGIIKTWNKGAKRIFGYAASEIIGKPIRILVPDHLQAEESEILARLCRGETIDHFETVRQHKDGRLIDVSLTVSPVRDEEGRIIGASKTARDITRRKKAERQLAEALEREKTGKEQAEAETRLRDRFLATLSHELRAPLSPILLVASDAAGDQALPREIRDRFETILKNAEMEATLIDDLLDLSRIAHGKWKLNKQITDVHKDISDTIAMLRRELEEKRIELTAKLEARRHFIFADRIRLHQLFWNILKNAIKFTPERGKISIVTASTAEQFTVVVKDSGIGMTREEIHHAFLPFSQAEDALYGGLGLGLAISKHIVELHSGQIEAFSAGKGCGASFSIALPVSSSAPNYPTPSATSPP